MICITPTTLKKSKKLLEKAVFVNSIHEGEKTIFEIVEGFKNGKNFEIFEILNKDTTIGFISTFPNPKGMPDDTVSLGAAYILPKYQKKGFGKKATKLFLKYLKQKGFKKVFTKTWSGNKASNKILQGLGFVETGRTENDRVNGDNTVEYIKYF
jgi:RimJ/RimL family protein N-acetyltransferase